MSERGLVWADVGGCGPVGVGWWVWGGGYELVGVGECGLVWVGVSLCGLV